MLQKWYFGGSNIHFPKSLFKKLSSIKITFKKNGKFSTFTKSKNWFDHKIVFIIGCIKDKNFTLL